jgi:hypothetical protein
MDADLADGRGSLLVISRLTAQREADSFLLEINRSLDEELAARMERSASIRV